MRGLFSAVSRMRRSAIVREQISGRAQRSGATLIRDRTDAEFLTIPGLRRITPLRCVPGRARETKQVP